MTVLRVILPFIDNRSLPNAGGTVWDVVFPDAPWDNEYSK